MMYNEKLNQEEILRARRETAIRRTAQAEKTILAVQDTASLNYNTQLKTEGAGYISDKTPGVNIHSRLAAAADGLAPGVSAQSSYNRVQPHSRTRAHGSRKARSLAEKESGRRVQALGGSAIGLP
jgi:hypothetical protein